MRSRNNSFDENENTRGRIASMLLLSDRRKKYISGSLSFSNIHHESHELRLREEENRGMINEQPAEMVPIEDLENSIIEFNSNQVQVVNSQQIRLNIK